MVKSIEDRLAVMAERRQKLAAQEQALKARLAKKEADRETRRKIVLGEMVLGLLSGEAGAEETEKIAGLVARHLARYQARPSDAELFKPILDRCAITLAVPDGPVEADFSFIKEFGRI